jgi:hypothetical protein
MEHFFLLEEKEQPRSSSCGLQQLFCVALSDFRRHPCFPTRESQAYGFCNDTPFLTARSCKGTQLADSNIIWQPRIYTQRFSPARVLANLLQFEIALLFWAGVGVGTTTLESVFKRGYITMIGFVNLSLLDSIYFLLVYQTTLSSSSYRKMLVNKSPEDLISYP